MIYSIDDLKIKFSNYAKLYDKVRHEVQAGRLIPVVRELYETDSTIDGKYLAGRIFGPSYLSFDYALYIYSLIPETVYKTYTSATFGKRKTKKYQNHFGTFTYRDIPPQRDRRHLADINIINEDLTLFDIIKPLDKLESRGLSATRFTDKRHSLT